LMELAFTPYLYWHARPNPRRFCVLGRFGKGKAIPADSDPDHRHNRIWRPIHPGKEEYKPKLVTAHLLSFDARGLVF